MRLLLRRLTRKSLMQFGNYRNLTVQDVINIGKQHELIACYYNLGNITFCDDILDSLLITEKYRIEKPGKKPELCEEAKKRWFSREMSKEERLKEIKSSVLDRRSFKCKREANIRQLSNPNLSKLQAINHGHIGKK